MSASATDLRGPILDKITGRAEAAEKKQQGGFLVRPYYSFGAVGLVKFASEIVSLMPALDYSLRHYFQRAGRKKKNKPLAMAWHRMAWAQQASMVGNNKK